ncbi:HVA22/TB2/DP1 family protein, putative [Plasmodium ovale wallikeri]|uniref:HVA22/TB2/DP1 family protein, putative n=1 Tax=Plasmodium ovale wallikeri TaxID=864142 RepID=A0A1A8YTJ8_PLAOA|nr:HVA22/TB2/DP1 family protein, putative [Plasmodium ovale wallikeri]
MYLMCICEYTHTCALIRTYFHQLPLCASSCVPTYLRTYVQTAQAHEQMKTAKIYSKNKEKDHEKSVSYGSPQNLNTFRRLSSKVLGDSLNGFDLNKALEKIDEHVKKYPVLNDMGKKLGIKPSYVVVSVGGFLLLSLIFGWGAALICNMVGFAYPGIL